MKLSGGARPERLEISPDNLTESIRSRLAIPAVSMPSATQRIAQVGLPLALDAAAGYRCLDVLVGVRIEVEVTVPALTTFATIATCSTLRVMGDLRRNGE